VKSVRSEVDSAMASVVCHSQFILGSEVSQLESELAAFVKIPYCISVANGTDALELALKSIDVRENDEVITTPFSWISSAECILSLGAKPVFVDINPNTFVIESDAVAKAVTPNTKAVIAVSLFGQMADLQAISKVLENHEQPITLIEDAAQSFGAVRDGICSGAWPNTIGCTSFFPTKPLGCFGDGGAVFTDNENIANIIKSLRVHGKSNTSSLHDRVGRNSRLDTLQAAVLRVMLSHFAEHKSRRIQAANRYNFHFQKHSQVQTPVCDTNTEHVYGVYTIRVPRDVRDCVLQRLKNEKVGCAVYYRTAFYKQPVFKHLGYSETQFPNTELCSETVISLPIGSFLSETEIDRIANLVISEINAART